METIEKTYPLETIVDELVKNEFQYEILTAKSAKRTECKLQHYMVLRDEMLQRHAYEIKEMDAIIERYKKPLEIREKAILRRQEKIKEIRGRLENRKSAIRCLSSLPPPAIPEDESESDDERVCNEIVDGVKTYSSPR